MPRQLTKFLFLSTFITFFANISGRAELRYYVDVGKNHKLYVAVVGGHHETDISLGLGNNHLDLTYDDLKTCLQKEYSYTAVSQIILTGSESESILGMDIFRKRDLTPIYLKISLTPPENIVTYHSQKSEFSFTCDNVKNTTTDLTCIEERNVSLTNYFGVKTFFESPLNVAVEFVVMMENQKKISGSYESGAQEVTIEETVADNFVLKINSSIGSRNSREVVKKISNHYFSLKYKYFVEGYVGIVYHDGPADRFNIIDVELIPKCIPREKYFLGDVVHVHYEEIVDMSTEMYRAMYPNVF